MTMARIEQLTERKPARVSVQNTVEAGYTLFSDAGNSYLQIVTYGSQTREMKGVVSQTIQFGPEGITALREILAQLP
ncbi:hypothetical protein HOY34_00055 [Xinfangfangia sp. D13-10-4-6]|uniref:hypothetical protein n=1 Tax=Pseudogemmobacter hezensis TaxID=2737662 RepID=UPI0015554B64|nr:hypothetical protein [Pseudogemmobacter hezensis]NPD13591.1 hypothetical protein [Pseudogemmobacter hezensis]